MAFLANDGSIIVDAVLTDVGRKRLARGDGSFSISKFALGDDEIDYGLYDKTNVNGSSYYDLTILQTPVLEASTRANVSLKSRLMTLTSPTILYLPEMRLFLGGTTGVAGIGDTAKHSSGTFIIIADETTETQLVNIGTGIMAGWRSGQPNLNHIRVDQGLDTTEISPSIGLDPALVESQWQIQMDDRFGKIAPAGIVSTPNTTTTNTVSATPSFVDSNQIATYVFGAGSGYVTNLGGGTTPSSIDGPRGTKFSFRVAPTLELSTSDYLFTQLGSIGGDAFDPCAGGTSLAAATWRFIDTTVNIRGLNTEYSMDISIRYIKYTG